VSDRAAFLLARIAELYPITPRAIERIARGMDTENWRIDTDDGASVFLKCYPPRSDRAAERSALALAMHARSAGIRTPRVITDRDGQLLHDDGAWGYAVFEFVADAAPDALLSLEQMVEAGSELARIHRAFRDVETPLPSRTPAWLHFDLEAGLGELERYRTQIEAREPRDAFDRATLDLLPRRRALLAEAPRLLGALADARSQVLHGDYSTQNVLFDGGSGRLAAVVDFGAPEPFLLAYEIGRIAFPPEQLVREGWLQRGLALLAAYRDEHSAAATQLHLAPVAWLVQLIRNNYGIRQHYGTPLEFQTALDRYGLERARGAEILFDNLASIIDALG
jgi:Ser/Thr protein kinase RdoA (MazF antagonist)